MKEGLFFCFIVVVVIDVAFTVHINHHDTNSSQIIVLQYIVTMKWSYSFHVLHLLTTITKQCVRIKLSSIVVDFTLTDDNYHNFEFSIRMIADKYDRLEDCMVSYDDYDKHTIS